MNKGLRAAVVAVAYLAISGAASAQLFPSETVHPFLPYPAGGAVDVADVKAQERILVANPARLYDFPN